jgi:hypothetical protein
MTKMTTKRAGHNKRNSVKKGTPCASGNPMRDLTKPDILAARLARWRSCPATLTVDCTPGASIWQAITPGQSDGTPWLITPGTPAARLIRALAITDYVYLNRTDNLFASVTRSTQVATWASDQNQ